MQESSHCKVDHARLSKNNFIEETGTGNAI